MTILIIFVLDSKKKHSHAMVLEVLKIFTSLIPHKQQYIALLSLLVDISFSSDDLDLTSVTSFDDLTHASPTHGF